MSEVHYINNAQISEKVDVGYKFELPKYGASTTDPTYYEPTATRIANMHKSAAALEGVFDFTGKIETKGKTKEQILKEAQERGFSELKVGSVDVRFSKHGLTREEVSQITMEKSLEVESIMDSKLKDKKDKKSKLEDQVALATAINISTEKALSKNSESADSAE